MVMIVTAAESEQVHLTHGDLKGTSIVVSWIHYIKESKVNWSTSTSNFIKASNSYCRISKVPALYAHIQILYLVLLFPICVHK